MKTQSLNKTQSKDKYKLYLFNYIKALITIFSLFSSFSCSKNWSTKNQVARDIASSTNSPSGQSTSGTPTPSNSLTDPLGNNPSNNLGTNPVSNPPPATTPTGTNDTTIVAGKGPALVGQGGMIVPTTEALVLRIQNGLQKNVSPLNGNFAKALASTKSNLPKSSDPTVATGYDQLQLLVYAACSDLTTGNTPLMQSKYKVNVSGSIASNQAALVAAGVQMFDQYLGGLASEGPSSGQIASAFTTMLSTISAINTNTSKIAFMSVCIAANTAGSGMLGL